MPQSISTNTFIVSKWVVSPTASQGTHTTIASAIASASSGDTIYIADGVYTENLTLKAGVNLTAFSSNELAPNVKIIGNATLSTAGSVTISGIGLQTNSANLLTVSGTLASIVNLIDCNLNCTNNTGISYSSSSATSAINLINCTGDLGTTGIALYAGSGAGTLSIIKGKFTNTGASTTASSNSAGNVTLSYSTFQNSFSTSSTGNITALYINIFNSTINTTCITTAGTGASTASHCEFASGTASCLSIGTGSSISAIQCTISSTNTNAITGAGTTTYSGISFTGSSTLINVTTQTGGTLQGGVNQAPSAGYVGEQIRSFIAVGSAITLSTGVQANITSISLTAGIWDVSGVVMMRGNVTGTAFGGSINTVSATVGNSGDNYVTTPFGANAVVDNGIVIPSYRLTLTATTTTYLVAVAVFTVGTQTAYGRISATRVG